MTKDNYKDNITDTTGILNRFKDNYNRIHSTENSTFNIEDFNTDITALIGGNKHYFDARFIKANINISKLKSAVGDNEDDWSEFIGSVYDTETHTFYPNLTYIKIILCIMYIIIFSEKLLNSNTSS